MSMKIYVEMRSDPKQSRGPNALNHCIRVLDAECERQCLPFRFEIIEEEKDTIVRFSECDRIHEYIIEMGNEIAEAAKNVPDEVSRKILDRHLGPFLRRDSK